MIDTLVIIGNGFDRWLGLNTGYDSFQKYYLENRDSILKKLHIKKIEVHDEEGNIEYISDVELIYGNPFNPQELDNDFWGSIEVSMSKIDMESLNLFFGKDRRGLRQLGRSVANAKRILREAFCQWILSIETDVENRGYSFGDNCLFINFNYTDTLGKAFTIVEGNEFHIHGEASDKNSIIFGHSDHPQEPELMLYKCGGRFRGLFILELLLRDTDKHTHENLMDLCTFLSLHGAMNYEIKDIYVLGQSMSPPDFEYIQFLVSSTKIQDCEGEIIEQEDEELDSLDELHHRIQYAVKKYGYGQSLDELDSADIEAGHRQVKQTYKEYEKSYYKMMRKVFKIGFSAQEDGQPENPRTIDAKWHISYHGEARKMWYDKVMELFECTEYELYPSIEQCIERFKLSK